MSAATDSTATNSTAPAGVRRIVVVGGGPAAHRFTEAMAARDLDGMHVTVLTEDKEGTEKKLKEIAQKEGGLKNIPLTIFEGSAGPDNYKIAKDADVTVLMWNQSKVKFNQAFAAGKLNEEAIEKVVKEVSTLKS